MFSFRLKYVIHPHTLLVNSIDRIFIGDRIVWGEANSEDILSSRLFSFDGNSVSV